MIDVSALSATQRAKHYRKLAADARREAELAHPTVRESYVIIAEQWERLAELAEAEAKPGG